MRGSCLCGDVAWEFSGTPLWLGVCHCSMCRKCSGAAFGSAVGAMGDGYHLLKGAERVVTYRSSDDVSRPFCSRCGSPVPGQPEADRPFIMPVGCLDDDPGLPVSAHIFVASKAPWHDIADDLPAFDEFPPGMPGAVIERPRRTEARDEVVRGSCLCGGVSYEIEGPPNVFLYCHCSRCRKAHGTIYSSLFLIDPPQLNWLRGEEQIERYKVPQANRFMHAFCRTCGTSLPQDHSHPPVVVPAGTLDDDPGVRPSCHIFTGSKAPWYEIPGDLPQFDEYPS